MKSTHPVFDLCVRNGTVITAADRFCADIGIREGRIVALARDLPAAERDIDATGLWVLPGGVDAHCHIEEPAYQGAFLADDFDSATRAAACGGTTTIVPFVNRLDGASLRESVEDYSARAAARSRIDYAFHIILGQSSIASVATELPGLMSEGFKSVKVFMNYAGYMLDDERILDVMRIVRQHQGVTLVHAENGHCAHWLSQCIAHSHGTGLAHFASTSPSAIEREATHRAITLAELSGSKTLLVHVSAAEAAEQIRWAHARGIGVLAETCPQYLVLNDRGLHAPGWEAAKFMCSPPLRPEASSRDLWRGVSAGTFSVVSSDHCPYSFEATQGKRVAGSVPDFQTVPPGLSGIETRLMLLFSEGVATGRISAEQFVAVTSTNPAKIYGLYPRKGSLMPGADADLVLWDSRAERVIRHVDLHDACDYTPYEGHKVRGLPVMTLSRGECLWQHGNVTGMPGRGRFIDRSSC